MSVHLFLWAAGLCIIYITLPLTLCFFPSCVCAVLSLPSSRAGSLPRSEAFHRTGHRVFNAH